MPGTIRVLCPSVDNAARVRFSEWLKGRLDASSLWLGEISRPKAGGLSSETMLLDADWGAGPRGLVIRLAPDGKGLFPSYDLAAQVRTMDALRLHTTVPVPTVLWHETDPAVLGREFVVMERVEGRIPSDNPGYHFEGWLKELDIDGQRRVFEESISTLASIHRIEWASAGLGFLPGVGIDRELAYWRDYLDWAADGERFPIIDATYEWCATHRPADEPAPALVWGDTRPGNIIYNDDLSVRAVLDWEMALVGPPELDLGWYLFIERTALQFAPQLPGFPDRAETIDFYERHLGRTVEDIDWYEIWGGLRSAAIMIRVADNLAELGLVPREFRGDNPVTKLLARMIG
jgi:aminoglycoside phosphotransferase (APT) family kinase protein